MGFRGSSDAKESARNAGDLGLIPGLGRSPGRGYGNQLHYSCLESSMDREDGQGTAHKAAKSQTQMNQLNIHTHIQ